MTAKAKTRYYFIDFENVHEAGLNGVDGLQKKDKVFFFYSNNAFNLSMENHIAIGRSKAAFEYIKTEKVAKNYLDFHLATTVGYQLAIETPDEAVIVSKDTGFNSVVDFWTSKGIKITRQPSITDIAEPAKETPEIKLTAKLVMKEASVVAAPTVHAESLSESYRTRIMDALKGQNVAKSQYTLIYKAVEESKDCIRLNANLTKIYPYESEKVGQIYRSIKAIYTEYRNLATKVA